MMRIVIILTVQQTLLGVHIKEDGNDIACGTHT